MKTLPFLVGLLALAPHALAQPAPGWTIEKNADPGVLDLFTGDAADVLYTVTVTKTDPGAGPITVVDSDGSQWQFSESGSVSYSRTFDCDADQGINQNEATILETGAAASASVTVNCYALVVATTATPQFTRTHQWTIDKQASHSTLTLAQGQQFPVDYTVTVGAGFIDSGWAVEGTIMVLNPAPIPAILNGISAMLSPAVVATVDCGVTFPYVLAPGASLVCSYSAAVPDGAPRICTGTAILQNTPAGTTDFSGTTSVQFVAASSQVDECVDVADDAVGPLGTVCAFDAPKAFTYTLPVGPYETCGSYGVENTAHLVTNDTGTTAADSWLLAIDVPCPGCTLTAGFWKTHSEYGPAPYHEAWALLPAGADTPFFLSGKSWYGVLWTAPQGNVYYNLARAYIAATLSSLNGAVTTPEVDAALAWAQTFFSSTPPSAKLSKPIRDRVVFYGTLLDNYNNGLIGPGHCSEEP